MPGERGHFHDCLSPPQGRCGVGPDTAAGSAPVSFPSLVAVCCTARAMWTTVLPVVSPVPARLPKSGVAQLLTRDALVRMQL